ncbi:hypothetical protein XO10_02920 [Marinitoga sp. 1135]|uniref:Putative TIM-barrel fold metal-dependent hydrolase n=1 Tax=Marinitoga piezophila (strain DSM 14283 / JCM 11233 / KA3) TaxID=443254 RepID=H2J5M6_MARPK|nr:MULTISPECIES: amidohydrolase family protein [Marinitoga]AEX85012.1 putative TIM-barrel fold metal-dependent hydrolase [Marinitoga piezophila KA3]NUU95237.1 hypothetical protein [Marinitoga sp. 1135]NUU97170.1 hypothetical protein [Marinitoga sp. 1138]
MYYFNEDGKFIYKNTKFNNKSFAIPVVTDTHMHILGFGEKLLNPDLLHMKDNEIIELILKKINEAPEKIILRGWMNTKINIGMLDNITKDIPIIMIRNCGHIALVNSKVFEDIDFKNKENIDVKTGLVKEKALEEIYNKYGYFSDINKAFSTAKDYLLKRGYGYIHSDDLHGIDINELPQDEELFIYEKIAVNNFDELIQLNNKKIFKKYKAVKVYIDGSFGGRTAYLREVYNDNKNTYGILNWKKDELKKVIEFCENNNLHLAMHAIGDKAIDIILDSFEELKPEKWHRIIHASMLHDEQIEKIKRFKLILDMQPQFMKSDDKMLNERLGNRKVLTYRFKEIYNHNIPMFFSSDAPVETPDWVRDAKILNFSGLPMDYILKTIIYSPKLIDSKDRNNGYIIFKENPLINLTYPDEIQREF